MNAIETFEIIEILEDAKKRIEDPTHWCQDTMARDSQEPCPSGDRLAIQWCAVGSITQTLRVKKSDHAIRNETLERLNEKCQQNYGGGIATVNDSHGHVAILECFNDTIRDLRNITAPIKDEMEL